ncbi:LysR family transcriptional regulator [Rugamonas sp.]|uniref:winged helix-turn-helix domain-containing protein n=1 Tax=Rugamonas sp. TaxID=1926287 RepID=UPI0025CEAC81|nr:LysR family transcriptional regulator [Rugamonas sp.]
MDLTLNLKLRLMRDEEVAMGPGKADLLEAIAEAGSISGAARSMGMSYRRAWLLVDVMNRCFQQPLVLSAAGGAQGGGAQLTEDGVAVLAQFRDMERAAIDAAQPHLDRLSQLLKRGA